MIRLRTTLLLAFGAIASLAASSQTVQAQPAGTPNSAQLLPPSTVAWVSIADINQLSADLKETQYGQLLADPAMQEFVEDLKSQLSEQRRGFGLTWDDMLSLAGGETAVAMIHEQDQRPAHLAMIDFTGKLANVPGVISRIDEELKKRGATSRNLTVGNTIVIVYSKDDAERLTYFQYGTWLMATDSRALAESLINRMDNSAEDSFANNEAFVAVENRLAADAEAKQSDAHVKWFVNVIGMAKAQRTLIELDHPAPPEGKRSRNLLDIVTKTGFDGIKGAGGTVTVRTDQYDLLSRIAVYAPRPWEKSLNMITLQNVAQHDVSPWVKREVATHSTFNLDLVASWDAFKWLFDATLGDANGAFEDVFEGIAEDPLGPQVNIRDQILAQFTGRVTLVTDNQQPINVNSKRRMLALPIKEGQVAGVADALNRLMAPDEENARLRTTLVPGVEVWELLAEKSSVATEEPTHRAEIIPVVSVSGPNGQDNVVQPPTMLRQESAAVCVAEGQLIYSSHISFLVDVLKDLEGGRKLANDIVLQNVNQFLDAEVHARGWDGVALKRFGRSEEEIHTPYELARTNRLHESESILARVIRNAVGGTLAEDGKQWFDGEKLPDFQIVRRFLQPSGQICHAETKEEHGFDGWVIIGITLRDRHDSGGSELEGNDADAVVVDGVAKSN
ncbi:MAG: DUF3352 domain-containing protein [Pirellulales bacterium]|nr:DUF3352 domain-containing protein [Pirellulales bacterium]